LLEARAVLLQHTLHIPQNTPAMIAGMSKNFNPKATAGEETTFPAKKLPPLPPEYERGFLTTSELQKTVLPLSRRSIFDYRRRGIIPSIQIGSKVLYHKDSVIAALLRRQNGGAVQ
jgi:hypothetical protein